MPTYPLETIVVRSIKISDDLREEARRDAELHGRSIVQQLEHWVRIGKAIERFGSFNQERVDAVLAARASTDILNATEYAVWSDAFEGILSRPTPEAIAFFAERRRLGLGVGLDENGDFIDAAS